jgi:methylated-DNA-[protein]-cysteine S-methyltransferase
MPAWGDFPLDSDLIVRIAASEAGVRSVQMNPVTPAAGSPVSDHLLIAETARQLRQYLAGERRDFPVPLDLRGTDFQRRVWQALLTIPYGETRTYRWLAETVGTPRGYQAVGQANGANPVCIIVPCHRVIASGGGLGGYAYGLDFKRRLLDLEARHAGRTLKAAAR